MVKFHEPVEVDQVRSMLRAIEHRGPDDNGLAVFNRGWGTADPFGVPAAHLPFSVGLGHQRLSIIDLSPLGHQPMCRDGCTVIYNGEIYNYVELRDELTQLGHRFTSKSDTEVLLQAYLQWGDACLTRLNGIFAFVILDQGRAALFCARDRVGVKPLYYTSDKNQILICSEIKGILAGLGRVPAANRGLIYDYLRNNRLDHTDETMFSGIVKLPPGRSMTITEQGIRVSPYWSLSADTRSNGTLEDDCIRFRELIQDSVRLQMRADVPVGSCLSGGLDSSTVVSLATQYTPAGIKTFTARFSDPLMDEWRFARVIHENKQVIPFAVHAEPQEFWANLQDVVRAQEEPFSDPGVFVQWRLMRLIASEGIRVVLDGQGGDELLCGYAKYFYFSVNDLLRSGHLMRAGLSLLDAILHGGPQLLNIAGARRYLPQAFRFGERSLDLLKPEFAAEQRDRRIEHPGGDVRKQQIMEIMQLGLPALLRYEDKNSMAHSLEARVPFLDHRLIEFAVALPTERKIHLSESKYVLRRSLRGLVPDPILDRRCKLGFGGHYETWVSALEPELSQWIASPSSPVFDFVEPEALVRLVERRDPSIFCPLVLDAWLTEFSPS